MSMERDLSASPDELQESNTKPLRLLGFLSEQSPLPLVAVEGPGHLVRYVNPAFCRLAEIKSEDLLGKPFVIAVPEAEGNGCLALLENVRRTGQAETLADQAHGQSPSELSYWSYAVWATLDEQKGPAGLMIQVTDTTQQTRARQLLGLLNERLLLSAMHQHERREVAEAGMEHMERATPDPSHRFRNNLQIITALLDMQIMEDEETFHAAMLAHLRMHTQTVASFHDLLTHMVQDDSQATVLPAAVVMERLLPMWRGIVGTHNFRWSADDVVLPITKLTSLVLLINELITNAAKHGGQEVDLCLALHDNSVTLTVSDGGQGFPPGFDPARSANFGLHFVESIVRLELEGQAVYGNRAEGGGVVTVTFPLPTVSSSELDYASVALSSLFVPSLRQEAMRSFAAFASLLQDHAIILLDERATILKWSLGAERLFGYSVEEMLGRPLSVLFTSEEVKAGIVTREIEQASLEGRASDDRWMRRKDGRRFFASGLLTALVDTDVRGFVKILRDMTESKQAEEERGRQQAQIAVLQERNRLSQEIHDTLAQGFTGIVLQLEAARDILAGEPEKAGHHIDRAKTLARASLAEARRSVHALRPALLLHDELPVALQRLVEQVTSGTSVTGEFRMQGKARPLLPPVEDDLLRIGQEALINALHHGQATHIRVELTYTSSAIQLWVQDNGRGFDALAPAPSGHYGLVGMHERAERAGGQLVIRSRHGQGTEVLVVVPNRASKLTVG